MARPQKALDQKRRHIIQYRVNDAELARLEAEGAKAGMTNVNRFARYLTTSRRVVVSQQIAFPFDVAQELRSLGININQQTRKLHMTGEIRPELVTLWAKLDGLLNWIIDHGPTRR